MMTKAIELGSDDQRWKWYPNSKISICRATNRRWRARIVELEATVEIAFLSLQLSLADYARVCYSMSGSWSFRRWPCLLRPAPLRPPHPFPALAPSLPNCSSSACPASSQTTAELIPRHSRAKVDLGDAEKHIKWNLQEMQHSTSSEACAMRAQWALSRASRRGESVAKKARLVKTDRGIRTSLGVVAGGNVTSAIHVCRRLAAAAATADASDVAARTTAADERELLSFFRDWREWEITCGDLCDSANLANRIYLCSFFSLLSTSNQISRPTRIPAGRGMHASKDGKVASRAAVIQAGN
ncbi:hypothetical protein C8R45DRAFT_1102663 [Mycena sanguinolenta]|nr:hypothetical protein C8R45DRAFT_1102663 [Mycena sanguinolenta]